MLLFCFESAVKSVTSDTAITITGAPHTKIVKNLLHCLGDAATGLGKFLRGTKSVDNWNVNSKRLQQQALMKSSTQGLGDGVLLGSEIVFQLSETLLALSSGLARHHCGHLHPPANHQQRLHQGQTLHTHTHTQP